MRVGGLMAMAPTLAAVMLVAVILSSVRRPTPGLPGASLSFVSMVFFMFDIACMRVTVAK